MARKQKGYWTPERLEKLEKLFPKSTPQHLVKVFGKPYEELIQTHEYALAHKRLKISCRNIRGRRITVYKPGYAEGAEPTVFQVEQESL